MGLVFTFFFFFFAWCFFVTVIFFVTYSNSKTELCWEKKLFRQPHIFGSFPGSFSGPCRLFLPTPDTCHLFLSSIPPFSPIQISAQVSDLDVLMGYITRVNDLTFLNI